MQASAPAEPYAAPYPGYNEHGTALPSLEAVLLRYEVTLVEAQQLLLLRNYRLVFIADDSSSMDIREDCEAGYKPGRGLGGGITRWDRLKETVNEVVDVAAALPGHGPVDVHFLNRSACRGAAGSHDARLAAALAPPPRGITPLTECVNHVVQHHRATDERPLLLFIATDGEPTGPPAAPRDGVRDFARAVATILRSGGVRFQFLACTEDERAIDWIKTLDRRFEEVDVTEDYDCEREEVLRLGGTARFTRGDWVMKALLGSISPELHARFHAQPGLCGSRCGARCAVM